MAKKHVALIPLSLMLLTGGSLTANAQSAWENPPTPPPQHEKQNPAVEKNLKVFDTLDFDVWIPFALAPAHGRRSPVS
jgi:hypothetical protein